MTFSGRQKSLFWGCAQNDQGQAKKWNPVSFWNSFSSIAQLYTVALQKKSTCLMNKCKSKLPLKFFGTVKWTYILQRGDGGALSSVVRVPVHVQDLLPLHRHDPRQDAFLWETQIPHTALFTHTISWTQTEQHCVYKQGYSTSEQVRGKERKHIMTRQGCSLQTQECVKTVCSPKTVLCPCRRWSNQIQQIP